MKTIQEVLEALGLNIMLLIGGAIGAFIGVDKQKPFWLQVVSIFTGAFIANYLSPVVIDLFSMNQNTLGGVGFIVGYMGKHALEFAVSKLKKKAK